MVINISFSLAICSAALAVQFQVNDALCWIMYSTDLLTWMQHFYGERANM